MEAIRISCAGYPTRKTFDDFLRRFRILAPDVLDGRYFLVVLLIGFGVKLYNDLGKTLVIYTLSLQKDYSSCKWSFLKLLIKSNFT
jgi:hypothetical protein